MISDTDGRGAKIAIASAPALRRWTRSYLVHFKRREFGLFEASAPGAACDQLAGDRPKAGISGNSGVRVDRLSRAFGTFWNVTVGWMVCNLLKMWWPETGLNRRRRPFQGLNKLCFQLLTSLRWSPKYSEIHVIRANHGWGITSEDICPGHRVKSISTPLRIAKIGIAVIPI
jgi:hypothetical protein